MFMRRAVDLGWLQNYTSQTSIAHLTQEKLAIVPLLNPQPEEQRAIASAFHKWNERISSHEAELTKLHSLKRGLAHDLLTGRKRVKL
jgi:type I restriction enzyme S subunit